MSLDIGSPEYVPLSMLNALAYCPRRFVYEFIQAEMLLNEHVVEGYLRHEGVDLGSTIWLEDAVQRRRVYVWSERLRIAGFCDVVEMRGGRRYPVEFKKGRPGPWRNDHIQVCAQALCLEERSGEQIERGFIFYFAVRRREEVRFTPELRADVERIVEEAHRLKAERRLPPPIEQRRRCRDCSLEPLCLPDELSRLVGAT